MYTIQQQNQYMLWQGNLVSVVGYMHCNKDREKNSLKYIKKNG